MSNATVERMAAAIKIHKEIDEVVAGKRGYVTFPGRRAIETGIKQSTATEWARKAGLSACNHGRYGLCFSRP